jgi:hypothetical protein
VSTRLKALDEGFFTSAPSIHEARFSIPRPAEEVWRELSGDHPLHWSRLLSIHWTSEPPRGVGSTRIVNVLGGAAKLKEHFFIWEEGRRYSFYATETNLPVFRRFGEDYLVEPDGSDRCRFTWTVGIEPTPLGRPGGPLNAILFRQLFAETRRHFSAR